MSSRWERFLRLLGKPVIYDNKRTPAGSKRELVGFVRRNYNNPTGSYVGKHWHLGSGMITYYTDPETIGFYPSRKDSFTGEHATLWFDLVTPASTWYSNMGLMELMLKGMCDDSKIKAFLVRESQE